MDPCMDDRISISRLKQADFQTLETLVDRCQVQAGLNALAESMIDSIAQVIDFYGRL